MSERILPSGKVVNLINRMADGTIREDMEGFVLPYNEKTKGIYNTLEHICDSIARREREEREKASQAERESTETK